MINAVQSGKFRMGDIEVARLGFGAMRVTGSGIWGPPEDPDEARRVLRRLPELGINLVDTAESYGPYVSEELIGETLAPYDNGITIATKSGLTRSGPNRWEPLGRPEFLRQGVATSLLRLKLDQLPLWQLHRIDPKVPRDEQFDCIRQMQREGLIRHVGLSEVTVEEIQAARGFFQVATVQNLYNVGNRQSEPVLMFCEQQQIGFIPWFPLAAGALAKPGGVLLGVAKKLGATPSQVALAWLLKRSPVMLPIPGTSTVKHLEENTAAASLILSDEDFETIDERSRAELNTRSQQGATQASY